MLGLKSYLHETFRPGEHLHEEPETVPEVHHATLYECSDCGTVFIESTGVRCSRCRSGTLTAIEQTY